MSGADISLAVAPPRRVADANAVDWQRACDVLVVGLGAAGAATAIAAGEAGADVCVVDRFGLGGASAKSGGVVYAGGGTRQQIAAGYQDTPQAMADYLQLEVGDAVAPATLRRFCEDSRDLIAWLESLGAAFDSDTTPPKTSYPPDGTFLYYSGNEAVAPYCDTTPPAPRGHRTADRGLSGYRLFRVLRERVDALGIPVIPQAAAHRLIVREADNTVLGAEIRLLEAGSRPARRHARLVRWAERLHNVAPIPADALRRRAQAIEDRHARLQTVRARQGVVLTTGGFIFNRRMVADAAPAYAPNMRLGTAGCDGSGIRLGQSVGAATGRLDKVSAWRFINPPQAWIRGIVVNADGERFCNEQVYGARLGGAMCATQDGRAWLIIDRNTRRQALRECLRGGLWAFQKYPALLLMLLAPRAATVAGLAHKLGLPEGPLCNSLHRYNLGARAGQDALDKRGDALAAQDTPRYYGIDIGTRNPLFPCPAITLGGLRVDETSGAVVDADDAAIPGLYAAGRAAVGLASNNYVSGLSLADCLWTGRRAGAAVAGVQHRDDDAA